MIITYNNISINITITMNDKTSSYIESQPITVLEDDEMYVLKRSGELEIVSFDKILMRVKKLGQQFSLKIPYTQLVMKVIDQLHDKIKTSEIDVLTAEQCAAMSSSNIDYNKLASAISVSNLQKNTLNSFSKTMLLLYNFKDVNGINHPLIDPEVMTIVEQYGDTLDNMIEYDRDFDFDYFGFKTLENAYLMKIDGRVVERPQYMWMRVSIGIHKQYFENVENVENANTILLEKIQETYTLMSSKYFIHATPTLFNAGTPHPQLSSCFLLAMEDDSIDGIFNTLKECTEISKWAGGIGLHIHNIRATGSHIRGTNGSSNGLIPMLSVFNKTAKYVNQGGKRNGSFAIYLEPHHPDIEAWLDLRKTHGDEDARSRDLFYGLWISDIFMERVKADGQWSLFCPDRCPELQELYGEAFSRRYEELEHSGNYTHQIRARDLWIRILDAQMETGTPYMLYKDACNRKSNQKNLGVIKSSNLCVAPETLILTDKGYEEIQYLKDKPTNVWNGKEFSLTTVCQTNECSELIEVHMSDETVLSCTKYHKFYIQTKYQKYKSKKDIIHHNSVEIIDAQDLKPDMCIIKCDYPVIDNQEMILEDAYTNGIFTGDGTFCNYKALKGEQFCKRHIDNCFNQCDEHANITCRENNMCNALSYEKKPKICLYANKINLLEHLSYNSCGVVKNNRLNVSLPPTLKEKFFVPINYSLKSKLDWFAGYCDADGYICLNQNNQSLQISSINKEFLINVKLMLQTCGINSNISLNMNERTTLLPENNKEQTYKLYNCKKIWRLSIASNQLQQLLELGLNCKRLNIEKQNYQRSANKFIKVKSVKYTGRYDATYCFNEPKRHCGIFNGIITSQCTEILEYSDKNETAVCNLASVSLPRFVKDDTAKSRPWFDFQELHRIVNVIVQNLNNIIDVNYYPNRKTRRSNLLHRPIGIGVQGLADVFILMDMPFTSPEAKMLNRQIFETIYHSAVEKSCEIAMEREESMKYLLEEYKIGNWTFKNDDDPVCREYDVYNNYSASSSTTRDTDDKITLLLNRLRPIRVEIENSYLGAYSSFNNSPMSRGEFQFDLWNREPIEGRYDWTGLKNLVIKHGLRNSLLCAPMPTASTSQILGNNECFEPLTSNLYTRRTLAGEFVIVNKHLVKELGEMGMWNESVKNNIVANRGSVQHIDGLPAHIREKYLVVWEMSMRDIIDMSRDRGAYICQSQSLNLWVEEPCPKILTNIHFYGWEQGLKTGMYYLRRKARHQAQQFTVEPSNTNISNTNISNDNVDKPDDCLMCSG